MKYKRARYFFFLAAFIFGISIIPDAHAQTTLWNFAGGADGAFPYGRLLQQGGGLYGATIEGGWGCGTGCGIIFQLKPPVADQKGWQKTEIWSFKGGSDGAWPWGGLAGDTTGALYGTTTGGGSAACDDGCGTVFRLSPPTATHAGWTRTTLVSFSGGANGSFPADQLIRDASGALYGTTLDGGANGCTDCGTIFRVSPPGSGQTGWRLQTLWRFGGNDGRWPNEGLLVTTSGAVYGATNGGGGGCGTWGCGTVFRLTPPTAQAGWTLTSLKKFADRAYGEFPVGYPVQDGAGALYVATQDRYIIPCAPGRDCGHVVKLTPPASGQSNWTATSIYKFIGGIDGEAPSEGALIRDGAGNLYGSTQVGGTGGQGTLFKLAPPPSGSTAWAKSTLSNFTDTYRARFLSMNANGNFYGTSDTGGSKNCDYGCGYVSLIVPKVDTRPSIVAAGGPVCIQATSTRDTATWYNKCGYYVDFNACYGGFDGQHNPCPFDGDFTHLFRYFAPGETRTAPNPVPTLLAPFNRVKECPRGYTIKFSGVLDNTCLKQ